MEVLETTITKENIEKLLDTYIESPYGTKIISEWIPIKVRFVIGDIESDIE